MPALVQWFAAQAAQALLLLALVVMPMVGRLHQVTHGGALDRLHAGQAVGAHTLWVSKFKAATEFHDGISAEVQTESLLELLQPGHTTVECLLLDQMALGDALHAASSVDQALQTPQAPPAQRMGRPGAQHVALFYARGPPAA